MLRGLPISAKGVDVYNKGIVIAKDCMRKSKEFALEVAKTVGIQEIKEFLFKSVNLEC